MSKLRDLEVGALAARFLRLCSEAERLIRSFRVSRIGLNLQSYREKRERPSSSAKRDGAHRVILSASKQCRRDDEVEGL